MNKVILIGRLVKDPEAKMTTTGKKVVSFSLAMNEGKSKDGADLVSYFNCSAWERTAEIVENYARKGTKICVVGRLQNRSWDKPDGTKGYATDIIASEIELLSARGETGESGGSGGEYQAPAAPRSTAAPIPAAKKPAKNDPVADEALPEIDVDAMNVQMPF